MSDHEDAIRRVTFAVRGLVLEVDQYRRTVAARYDISVPGLITLADLRQSGPLTPRAIGNRLGWTTGGVTALVDRLEGGGYVRRAPNPTDRRSVLVHLTDRGRRATARLFARFDDAVARATEESGVNHEQLIVFLEVTAASLGGRNDRHGQRASDRPA
jgi:DNA-binding MarR family transcriptional regulator